MKVKGDNGIEFELADEVATAMITAGIVEEIIDLDADPAVNEISEAVEEPEPEPEPAKSKK